MIKKPAPAGFFIAFDLALPQRQARRRPPDNHSKQSL